MQHFITLVDFPASINYSHTAVALSQTFMTPIQKKSILVSLHCTRFFFSIIVNNHKTKAQTKLLLIPGLVSLFQNLKIT